MSVTEFPVYRRPAFPMLKNVKPRPRERRAGQVKNPYDYRWRQCRGRYIRAHPFCRFCEQEGQDATLAEDVDHIVPLTDGGERLKWKNLQSLCKGHHSGLKQQMEIYARNNGVLGDLPEWCENPKARPRKFQRGV